MQKTGRTFQANLQPFSTLAFDWLYTGMGSLVTLGFFLDGFSHGTFGPDQSVFSEYHFLMYTSFILTAVLLFGQSFLNRGAGAKGLSALPKGYELSAFGITLFGVTGIFDQVGHAAFGFEVGIEAFFSPTHMGLFIGWGLLILGPVRAALAQEQIKTDRWADSFCNVLPALVSCVGFINVLSFAIGENFYATTTQWMLFDARPAFADYGYIMGIVSMITQTLVLVGCLTWMMKSLTLPIGSFTLFFTLFSVISLLFSGITLLPCYVLTGVAADSIYHLLKNSKLRLHAVATVVPLVFWLTFYAIVFATGYGGGVWYTSYMWTGSIVQATVAGLLFSLIAGAPVRQPAVPT